MARFDLNHRPSGNLSISLRIEAWHGSIPVTDQANISHFFCEGQKLDSIRSRTPNKGKLDIHILTDRSSIWDNPVVDHNETMQIE